MINIKLPILLFFLSVHNYSFAQKHYFGAEIGVKFDKFEYYNSTGFHRDIYAPNGNWGFYFGTRKKHWNIEYGFYGFYSARPSFSFDKEKKIIEHSGLAGSIDLLSSEGEHAWVLPLRFSKEYFNKKKRLYINPTIGCNLFIYRSNSGRNGGWGINSSFQKTSATSYRKQKITMGIEGSLACGVHIKKRLDIYLKATFYNGFNTVFYEDIVHEYYDGEVIRGSNSFKGVAYALLFGIKYNYENLKQIKKLLE